MNSYQAAFKFIGFSLFLFIHGHLAAQTVPVELKHGTQISSEIRGGEVHKYKVNLAEDQFAFIKLMQQGIDLGIKSYDPDNRLVNSFDSPNGQFGAEFITIVSSKKGEYLLRVEPLESISERGKYTLEIIRIEQRATTPDKEVDQMFSPWSGSDNPGVAVAVVKDGEIVLKKGYGMANLEYDIPVGPSTVFHIASVSKQFTAFAVLLLAKEGKLSLDDDIRKFIPEVPDFGKTITLRQLANHTSGLRDQWNLLAMAGWRLDDVITKEHVMKLVSRQKDLNFEPGSEYLYCNTGYTLLAEVVARVSGRSFKEFTDERIFRPLKMKHTLFYDDHEEIVPNRAYSYSPRGAGYRKSVLSYANVGATSLFTTVEDLSLWAINFENPVVGDRAIMEEMQKQGVLNNGTSINYALGQIIGKYKGFNTISHGGGDAGFRTFLGRMPEHRFSVVVLSNDGAFDAGGMALKIADIYLKDLLPDATDKDETRAEVPKPKPSDSVSVDAAILESYVGQYELSPNFVITVTYENGMLYAQATGQSKTALQAVTTTKFLVQNVEAEVSFEKGAGASTVNTLKLNQGGAVMAAKRIKPFDPKAVKLSAYAGRFYSPELATEYEFIVEDGKLKAKHSRLSDIELKPAKPDRFTGNVWFFRDIEFVRNDKNEITGIKVSSGRVRNVAFEKITFLNHP